LAREKCSTTSIVKYIPSITYDHHDEKRFLHFSPFAHRDARVPPFHHPSSRRRVPPFRRPSSRRRVHPFHHPSSRRRVPPFRRPLGRRRVPPFRRPLGHHHDHLFDRQDVPIHG
jgi:hypothetical protein